MPQRTAVADHLCRNDISDSPFGYAAVSLDAVALRAADRAADYRQPFLFCDFGAFENRPGSDRIDRTVGPILGTLADTRGFKKPIFMLCLFVGVAGCCAMGLATTWMPFLIIFILAKIGFSGSLVFYDSMLGDVTTPERMDVVSSQGYAWGYIGSCVPFVVCLALVLGSGAIGLSQMTALSVALLITAVWWLGTTLPLLRSYKQINYVEVEQHAIRQSFVRIGHTLKHLREDKQVFWFLLAFFCYIDGVYTIIDMATAYGTALGLETTGLLLALLVTQIVAFPSALIFGRLSAKYPSSQLIPVCIAAYTGIAVFAFFLTSQWQFWILAVLVGMFQGGVQALRNEKNLHQNDGARYPHTTLLIPCILLLFSCQSVFIAL